MRGSCRSSSRCGPGRWSGTWSAASSASRCPWSAWAGCCASSGCPRSGRCGGPTQQNPEAVDRWKREQFPAIRAQAARAGATIWFADEAGVRSDNHAGTTWAPVGHTPIVRTTGARHSVNLISAVTAQGALRFAAYEGTFTSATFIDFCKRLLHDSDRPVFLVVDGHPTHRSRAVKDFVASTNGRLRLFLLPGYSPELNPDEWVWKNIKADRVGRAGVTGADDLKAKAVSALHRLQKRPHLIRGFLR